MKKKLYIDFTFLILTALTVMIFMSLQILSLKQFNLLGIRVTTGVFIFPLLFIISDIVSEVYGYNHSRLISLISAVCGLAMFFLFTISIILEPHETFTLQKSFNEILSFSPFVIIVGLFSFLLGDFLNDIIFEKLKQTGKTKFFGRVIISSFFGEMLDGLLFFIPLAIVVWGVPISGLKEVIINSIILGSLFRIIFELAFFPVTYFIVNKLKRNRTVL